MQTESFPDIGEDCLRDFKVWKLQRMGRLKFEMKQMEGQKQLTVCPQSEELIDRLKENVSGSDKCRKLKHTSMVKSQAQTPVTIIQSASLMF